MLSKIDFQNIVIAVVQIIANRCLTRGAATKSIVYTNIMDAVVRVPGLSVQFLDLLLRHSETLPEFNPNSYVISTKSLVELKEPLPQFIQVCLKIFRFLFMI